MKHFRFCYRWHLDVLDLWHYDSYVITAKNLNEARKEWKSLVKEINDAHLNGYEVQLKKIQILTRDESGKEVSYDTIKC